MLRNRRRYVDEHSVGAVVAAAAAAADVATRRRDNGAVVVVAVVAVCGARLNREADLTRMNGFATVSVCLKGKIKVLF